MPPDVDTSSYPRPASLPVQRSALDQAQQFGNIQQQQQQIQSGALAIDKQKLDLVNQRFGEMAKGFTALIKKPDLTQGDIQDYVTNQVKLGYVPPEMAAQTLNTLPPTQGMQPAQVADVLRNALSTHLQHAQTVVDAINTQAGTPSSVQDQRNIYTGVTASPLSKTPGAFTPASRIPVQLPPTQENVNPDLSRGPIGASEPPGIYPAGPTGGAPSPQARRGGLPVAPQVDLSAPVRDPSQGNLTDPAPSFDNRFGAAFPNRVVSSARPGVAEAVGEVGTQSGKDYAVDLTRAKNFKADLYPAETALQGIKELGVQGVGPGTEALNSLKSAIVTWLPNVDQKVIDNVGTFEQTRKYLTQIARSSGTTGTNDQLAAAFEANPSIKMSQAATENVLKSVIALRKMQHAQTLLFGQSGLQPDKYSQWIAQNQNVLDPRAFGFDMMDNNAQKKLVGQLKKDPKAYKRFEDSLSFAHDAGLIEPPNRAQ